MPIFLKVGTTYLNAEQISHVDAEDFSGDGSLTVHMAGASGDDPVEVSGRDAAALRAWLDRNTQEQTSASTPPGFR